MGKRDIVWKTPDFTADGLKMFACISLLLQSIGVIIVENGLIHLENYTQESLSNAMASDSGLMTLAGIGSILQLAGGMAIPIFAFLLVEGFKNTSDKNRYLLAVLLTALVSEVPYDWAVLGKIWDMSSQNAMLGTAVSLLMVYFLDMVGKKEGASGFILKLLVVFAGVIWVSLICAQFGLCMVLLTAIFYLFDTRNVLKTALGIIVSLLYVTGPAAFYGIWCYTGERKDKVSKYVFYAFYPMHLLLLGMISKFL